MVTVERDGSLTFRVYLPHAQSVDLVGDFNNWAAGHAPLLAEREPSGEQGWWRICFRCPAGDHIFSYLVDNRWWYPDYAAHGVQRNAFGNWTSLLCVPASPPPATSRPRKPHAARIDREFPGRAFDPRPVEPAIITRKTRWDLVREISAATAAVAHPSAG